MSFLLRPRLYAILLTLTACPSNKGDTDASATEIDTSGASDAMTEPTTGAEETGGPSFVDLFACPVPQACEQIVSHIEPEPWTALECAARLIVSTTPGIISALDTPGPDVHETETLVVSRGDGTALVQTRERHCSFEEEPDCSFEIPWEPVSAHQLCKLDIPDDLAENCGCGEDSCQGCDWDPFFGSLGECEPVEDVSCDALIALIGDGT